jgi:hypothetical protein
VKVNNPENGKMYGHPFMYELGYTYNPSGKLTTFVSLYQFDDRDQALGSLELLSTLGGHSHLHLSLYRNIYATVRDEMMIYDFIISTFQIFHLTDTPEFQDLLSRVKQLRLRDKMEDNGFNLVFLGSSSIKALSSHGNDFADIFITIARYSHEFFSQPIQPDMHENNIKYPIRSFINEIITTFENHGIPDSAWDSDERDGHIRALFKTGYFFQTFGPFSNPSK